MFDQIMKRNQEVESFHRGKIEAAIFKALVVAKGHKSRKMLKNLSIAVTDRVIDEINMMDYHIPEVEVIQDAVEMALMQMGEYDTAKAYIKYRYKHLEQRESKKSAIDILTAFDDYMGLSDQKAPLGYSLQGLNKHIISKATKHFWLNQVYSESVRDSHDSGDICIHDLGVLSAYSCGWQLEDLLKKGFGRPGGIQANAPKHLDTALLQLVNFVTTLQTEAAGAQTISNFDTLLAPFVRLDNLNNLQVKEMIYVMVLNLNISGRLGMQKPICNISLDVQVPKAYEDQPVLVGGQYHYDLNYGDFQKEMDMINMALCDVLIEGDAKNRPFSNPGLIYHVHDGWHWQGQVYDKLVEMTATKGNAYFMNKQERDKHLLLDTRKLHKRGNGLLGAYPKTGAIGIVSINLARIGYLSDSMQGLFDRLERLMVIAKDSLETKRRVLEENTNKGLYPYSQVYLKEVNNIHGEYWYNHFAGIGTNGMNECILNLTNGRENILTDLGKTLACEILEFMNEVLIRFQIETGHYYCLEAPPTDEDLSTLAKKDVEKYPDIILVDDQEHIYTNSSHLPVAYYEDIFDALEHQEDLQVKYTGGTVFVGRVLKENYQAYKSTLIKILTDYKIPCLSMTRMLNYQQLVNTDHANVKTSKKIQTLSTSVSVD